jgi:hypothetical protein
VQDVRESRQVLARFHGIMAGLLAESRSKPPSPNSIAAHLLAITDPRTGAHARRLALLGWHGSRL